MGKTAILPCDIDTNLKDDRIYMVLWYRDKQSKPIYMYGQLFIIRFVTFALLVSTLEENVADNWGIASVVFA